MSKCTVTVALRSAIGKCNTVPAKIVIRLVKQQQRKYFLIKI